jgi:hypothetical protein
MTKYQKTHRPFIHTTDMPDVVCTSGYLIVKIKYFWTLLINKYLTNSHDIDTIDAIRYDYKCTY